MVKRAGAGGLLLWGLLGCTQDPDGVGYSPLADDVEVDGWVDMAHPLSGDGATEFETAIDGAYSGDPIVWAWPAEFMDWGFDAGATTSRAGEHLLSLSRYRGLTATLLTGVGAPRFEAALPLGGLPVGMFVSEGVAAVFVANPVDPHCPEGRCPHGGQSSRLVLVDVEEPTRPRVIAEQRFDGTVAAARQVGGALHVLSRTLSRCSSCATIQGFDFSWLTFDRRAPRELPAARLMPLDGSASFEGERLVVLSPGASWGDGAPELRIAELSQPEPVLSEPIALAGEVARLVASGDRLRVMYGTVLETFALGAGTAQSLGRGSLAVPDGESLWDFAVEGERAVTVLQPSNRLAVVDISDASAPRIAGLLPLELSATRLRLAADRVLVAGHSTRAADAPPADTIAHGPQAVALVDITNPAAPALVGRDTLGAFDSELGGVFELADDRAYLNYYESFPTELYGTEPERDDCGRSKLRLVGYDLASGGLVRAFAADGLDADAQLVAAADDVWLASSVSVSRFIPGFAAPAARAELTRSINDVRALSDGVALFGVDFASNGPTLELASALTDVTRALDVSTAIGLSRAGCGERRRWAAPAVERDGLLYALRFHRPADGSGAPAAATLHVLDIASASAAASIGLEPLAAGEDYLGVIQTDQALLVARGRPDATTLSAGAYPRSLFSAGSTDPTGSVQSLGEVWGYGAGDGSSPSASLSYDVISLADPSAPALAGRLDIDAQLVKGGFLRFARAVTRDTSWGLHSERFVQGPAVVSGSIVVGQHSEEIRSGLRRFYLDRFDLTEPAAPVMLEPIAIPGTVLDFDAPTGALITLDALRVEKPAESPLCDGVVRSYEDVGEPCAALQRSLSGLVVDGSRATRVGQLLLDTDERRVVRFAVSGGRVYYATQPRALSVWSNDSFAAREVTVERVALRDGRFERFPSFDVAGATELLPAHWEQFAASGERVIWSGGGVLVAVDFSGSEPRIETHDIGSFGCVALDLRGDTAYCAQGQAGVVEVRLGQP
jgi:hypothetical protein